MTALLRAFFVIVLLRPVSRLLFGMNIVGREQLPVHGPAIIAANHNSHMDTVILITSFPARALGRLRPVAAADHFDRGPLSRWFFFGLLNAIPLDRKAVRRGDDPLAGVRNALEAGDIVILFPEGTRGEPEIMGELKTGVAKLAGEHQGTPVYPVYLQGAGRAWPRGSRLLVPFDCWMLVGEPLHYEGERKAFMEALRSAYEGLKAGAPPLYWD